jgi:hypothetical protein
MAAFDFPIQIIENNDDVTTNYRDRFILRGF